MKRDMSVNQPYHQRRLICRKDTPTEYERMGQKLAGAFPFMVTYDFVRVRYATGSSRAGHLEVIYFGGWMKAMTSFSF